MARPVRRILLLSALLFCLFTPRPGGVAWADKVVLKNGVAVVGKITKETQTAVTIVDPVGTWIFSRTRIARVERQSGAKTHLDLGKIYLKENALDRAIGHLESALHGAPRDREVRTVLARAYTRKAKRLLATRRYQSARTLAIRARGLDPAADTKQLLRTAHANLAKADKATRAISKALKKGDLKKARQEYYKLFAFSPGHREEMGAKMADLLITLGDQFAKKDRRTSAADVFEEAIVFDPTVAASLERKLVFCRMAQIDSFLNANRPKEAMGLLEGLLRVVPENALSNYYYGVLLEATRGDFQRAAHHYAVAAGRTIKGKVTVKIFAKIKQAARDRLKIGRGPKKTAAQIKTIRWDLVESKNLKIYETENFKIHHRNRQLAREVGRVAERHRLSLLRTWPSKDGKPAQGKIEIFIYKDGTEYAKRAGQPSWSGGSNKITTLGKAITRRAIYTYQTANGILDTLMPHELAHVLFTESVGVSAKIPRWLNEGIAIQEEPPYRTRFYDSLVRSRVLAGDGIPLSRLMGMKQYPDEKSIRLYYGESYSLVKFLLARPRGRDTIIRYCRQLGTKRANRSLAQAFGFAGPTGPAELEAAWKATLK